ncbi:MAG: AAA family ATPase [Parachlamydiales bacterium]|nr:AAA family ATPase [Parachlamydiales bacterium]
MIKTLFLSNIYLFKNEQISFSKNFNVLTGETGSGKTTILNCISLILGERANLKTLTDDKAILEATFEIKDLSSIKEILKEDQIGLNSNQISIRREIFKDGKNRCFINDELISITTLKKLSPFLIEIVSQHSNQDLLSKNSALILLDKFSNLEKETKDFSKNLKNLNLLEEEIKSIETKKNEAEGKKQKLKTEKQLIEDVNLLENEEEELEKEHTLLINSHEIHEKIDFIYNLLIENENAIIPSLKSLDSHLRFLKQTDETFSESFNLFENAGIELDEISYLLMKYKSKIDINPKRLEEVESRLLQIHKLKKRFGSYKDIQNHLFIINSEINSFENLDDDLKKANNERKKIADTLDEQANFLTKQRLKFSKDFEEKVSKLLKELNMVSSTFKIDINKDKRSFYGDDAISFLFSANLGKKPDPLHQIASGGELSRLMLAIKTVLNEKDQNIPIIFDEIDANVGGQSATIIGQKLKKLASFRQIILITHFVQVAKCADSHLLISKREKDNSTYTIIEKLLDNAKEKEYQRMIGK